MSQGFIFCPFCGASEWIAQKYKGNDKAHLTNFECYHCGDFTYKMVSIKVEHPDFSDVTQSILCLVEVRIAPYKVNVNYVDKETIFEDVKSNKPILQLNQVVDFDWFKGKVPILEKVKTYVVFS